jgi:hypothetical protein
MNAEFQVQKAGLAGTNWTTVCRAPEATADVSRRARHALSSAIIESQC